MSIIYRNCDLLTTTANYIAHQVNCKGVMGAGLAYQIRQQYPELYNTYKALCNTHAPDDLLGNVYIHGHILNIFGQRTYGRDKTVVYTDYTALRNAFSLINRKLPPHATIAFPYGFGCGLANGDWNTVLKLITDCFPIRTIYICKK